MRMSQSTHSVGLSWTMRSVLSRLPSHGAAAERLGHGSRDVVAEDGERGGGRSQVARHPRPQRGVRAAGRTVHLLEGPTLGRADLDAVHDRVAEDLGQEARRALVGRRDIGRHHPHAPDGQLVLPERGIDREDLPPVDAAHGPALRDVSAHCGQGDVPEQLCVGEGIRQVVPGGPDGRAPRCGLQRDEGRPEGAATEQEVPRCRELRRHAHAPVQFVAVGLHAQEGPCVHGAAPYRRWSSRRQLTEGRVLSASPAGSSSRPTMVPPTRSEESGARDCSGGVAQLEERRLCKP